MQHFSTPDQVAQWLHQRGARRLHTDSRKVAAGDAFLAWPGARHDGRRHVEASLQMGAAACLFEAKGFQQMASMAMTQACATYTDLKSASGHIASSYYEHPSLKMDVLALTGTNGKTSCAWWLAQALIGLGQRCAMVGTLGLGEVRVAPGRDVQLQGMSTGLTTPDAVLLQGALRDFVQAGVRSCVIEASSIGLEEGRLEGTRVRVALFTNFTQDHLDYHGDMSAYWQAKRRLFDWPELQCAVVALDDPKGRELVDDLRRNRPDLRILSYGLHADADLRAEQVRWLPGANGQWTQRLTVCEGSVTHEMSIPWVGEHNVRNMLAVIAGLRALGHDFQRACLACADLQAVPGRMQALTHDHAPLAVVDYAHTPDALAKALQALRPLAEVRGGQLWCVFGCGGDRDRGKRAEMGRIAQSLADHIVLTSDNPRSEDPLAIVRDIRQGLSTQANAQVQVDRALAIVQTLARAQANDVVLIAGKGHETYQEVGADRLPFSDVEQVQRAWRKEAA
ncbi:MAG: UDP-N-acetylmuramoyl-L-alanyl-D-glutamate--2,6-diaminopimelate ligase [Alphaproteobacteria bacterium]|nr:UDP-N-acetylmuramoyl-L-alanyl-D-glutamate--2,6-diaminopimelate ligase [Alphaproteobacteria bacterium]MDI9329905.1 UDP-N-acetylmuramoyl-L-alanyl-D-glutamate--2,6-diaminopimelate ligase [Alphaproteobacteria bacterium]